MKPVRKLPPEVCRVMRSGVTIPTPAQGVVEMVLNSIDAKASSIAIRVDLKLMKIQVIDNGVGIMLTDLDTIGSRSNTSKCYSLEEYYNNLIYHGYRGEALASLCELSGYLEIVTRPADCDDTYKKLFVHGKAEPAKVSDMKRPTHGTTITINDFMFNMPVRRSGMKEAVELEDIRSHVEYIALVHPELSVSLRNDLTGRIILEKHKSCDLLSSFEYLFGHTLSHTMAPINFFSSKFKINGYISKEAYRHNDLQFIYINRKPVIKTKLNKFVCALLAKSSIIRSNGSWKNKPIPKNVPPERWLSFPSLEKVKKFAVFILNISCSRDEYEIIWDSKKTSIYFKDWDGILNSVSESIQSFLRMENLVDEELSSEECTKDGKEQGEEKISSLKDVNPSCSEMPVPKSHKDSNFIEPAMETWNMPGVIHGITAKRGKRNKTNIHEISPKLNVPKPSEHVVAKFTTPSVSGTSNNNTAISVYNDELSSVPPVVKFLGKIETPEFARLKIVPGAYRLKMMEEENKRQQIAKKLGMFKFPCKPKLGNGKSTDLIDTQFPKFQDSEVKEKYDIELGTNCLKKNKKNIKMEHQTKCERHLQIVEALCHGKEGKKIEQTVSISLPSTSSTCYVPKKKHKESQGILQASSSFHVQEKKINETVDLASTPIESMDDLDVEELSFKEGGTARNKYHSDNCIKERCDNVSYEIPFQYTSPSVNVDENDVSYSILDSSDKHFNNDINFNLNHEDIQTIVCKTSLVSSKVHSKYNNLKISEVTVISIPTPCVENSSNVVKCKSLEVDEISTENNKILEDKSVKNVQEIDQHLHQHDKSFDNSLFGETSFHSKFLKNNESHRLGDKSSFSSFVNEFTKRRKSKLPFANSLDSSSQMLSQLSVINETNVGVNERKLISQNEDTFRENSKDSLSVKTHNASSHSDIHGMDKIAKENNFLKIFEGSVQLANSDILTQSPYFNFRSSKNTFNATNKRNLSDYPAENSNPILEREGPCKITLSQRCKNNFMNEEINKFENTETGINDQSIKSLSPVKTKENSLNESNVLKDVEDNLFINTITSPKSNDIFQDKQFFEVFEASIQHVNSDTLISSPYFSFQKSSKNCLNISDKERLTENSLEIDKHMSEKEGLCTTSSPSKNINMLISQEKVEFEHSEDKDIIRNSTESEQVIKLFPTSMGNCENKSILNKTLNPSDTNDLVPKEAFLSMNKLSTKFIEKEGLRLTEEKIDQDPFQSKNNDAINLNEEKSRTLKTAFSVPDTLSDENQILENDQTNKASSDKSNEERKEIWHEVKNFEGKKFFFHVPSGFTSFNAPFSDTVGNSYEMTKRFEFVPKGMSPVLTNCQSFATNFKQMGQFCREVDNRWRATENNDLKTIKWRNKTDFGINDVCDIFDRSKSTITPLHQSSVPDLSYTFAKMSKLLNEEKFNKSLFSNIQVIGQLDNKFIVTLVSPDQCTSPCVLGLFDQHAVHERIRLEALTKEYSSYNDDNICFKSTKLEQPVNLTLGTKEHRIMSSFTKNFERLGFQCIMKEECVEIHDIPTCLHSRFLRERSSQWLETTLLVLIQDIVHHLVKTGGQDLIFPEVLRDIINSEACKGAIKFGDTITKEHCQELLFYLSMCNVPFFCAHGRPSFMPIFDLRVFESERLKRLSYREV